MPVLIVGGGPVGLAVAIGLRHFGVDCLLVEQHDSTLDFPKGRAVNARAMEILRQWDVEDRVRAVGLPAEETSFGFLGETLLASEFTLIPFVEPSAGVMSPCDRIVCSQELLEPILRDVAVERGADVRFGHRLMSLEQDDDGVVALVDRVVDGSVLDVRARFLVATDGARSSVRERLGIGLEGPGALGNSVSILIDAPLRELIADRAAVLYGVRQPRVGGGFAVVDNNRRWLLMLPRDPESEPEDSFTEEYCVALAVAAVGDPSVPVSYRAHRFWQPTARWATSMAEGRVFLADAIHDYIPSGRPGGRAPHVTMDDGRSILDHFGTAFVVLVDETHPARTDVERIAVDAPLHVVTMSGQPWRTAYGVSRGGVVVVRPDGFVSFRSVECHSAADVIRTAMMRSTVT